MGDNLLHSAPKCVDEPFAVIIKSLHRPEKRPTGQVVDLINPVLLGDLHKNFLVAHEPDVLRIAVAVQLDLLIGQADQIAFTGT